MDLKTKLDQYFSNGLLLEKHKNLFTQFYTGYLEALVKNHIDPKVYEPVFLAFLERLKEQVHSPFPFEPYHKHIRKPFDYYQFGLDFMKPLIDLTSSSVTGHAELKEISAKLKQGENVIFLANHQIEADPQALSILLEDRYKELAEEMISVAGERVLTDPLAAPFSMGRNLLCIYSKRYIDHPPERKTEKQTHNKKTMELMSQLLSEGGHSIYVAPSGGRDRLNTEGVPSVAKFDPQSIEMFYLMARKASKPTSFYPMALSTYHILPPPKTIQTEIGEARQVGRGGIHLWVGPQIQMDSFPGASAEPDKKKRRELRAEYIWNMVNTAYINFPTSGEI